MSNFAIEPLAETPRAENLPPHLPDYLGFDLRTLWDAPVDEAAYLDKLAIVPAPPASRLIDWAAMNALVERLHPDIEADTLCIPRVIMAHALIQQSMDLEARLVIGQSAYNFDSGNPRLVKGVNFWRPRGSWRFKPKKFHAWVESPRLGLRYDPSAASFVRHTSSARYNYKLVGTPTPVPQTRGPLWPRPEGLVTRLADFDANDFCAFHRAQPTQQQPAYLYVPRPDVAASLKLDESVKKWACSLILHLTVRFDREDIATLIGDAQGLDWNIKMRGDTACFEAGRADPAKRKSAVLS